MEYIGMKNSLDSQLHFGSICSIIILPLTRVNRVLTGPLKYHERSAFEQRAMEMTVDAQ